MKHCLFFFGLLLTLVTTAQADAVKAKDRVVKLTASVGSGSPNPGIVLRWAEERHASSYDIHRKALGAQTDQADWILQQAGLTGGTTVWTDTSVAIGQAYEYRVTKNTSYGYTAYGYVYAGIKMPPVENRGKVLIVYAPGVTVPQSFKEDLIADGWQVVFVAVEAGDTAAIVHGRIRAVYNSEVKAAILVGHVPVPYSGKIVPDGHADHYGAWPADSYYADMNYQSWTDDVDKTGDIPDARLENRVQDGKWDQDTIPTKLELEVGRIDFSNLQLAFPTLSESQLLARYFAKNTAFKRGSFRGVISSRSAISDFWQDQNDAYEGTYGAIDQDKCLSSTAWANFSVFSGILPDNTFDIFNIYTREIDPYEPKNYFEKLKTTEPGNPGYLWSAALGEGGSAPFYGLSKNPSGEGQDPGFPAGSWFIGEAADFDRLDLKSVFTLYGGSYCGDWDTSRNFLRSALGSGTYTLSSAWIGRPHWFFHHMALGHTIGYSTRITQNNGPNGATPAVYRGADANRYGEGQIHIALLGDPTLRMHVVKPVTGLSGSVSGSQVGLTWLAPTPETGIQGYYVYRATNPDGPFTRVTPNPVASPFNDAPPSPVTYTYMVRTVKLEDQFSGSYTNLSLGVFSTVTVLPTGTLDTTFNPGTGPDNMVNAVARQSDGKIVIGGTFGNVNGTSPSRPKLARLNSNGTVDNGSYWWYLNFDASVYAVAIQPDGKILVGGDFSSIYSYPNWVTRNKLARLNVDGSLDTTFNNPYLNGTVRSIAVMTDGSIVVGGDFVNNSPYSPNYIARYSSTGSMWWSPGSVPGANGPVHAVIADGTSKVIIGGAFTWVNGQFRTRLARLSLDTVGTVDSFNSGSSSAPDSTVYAMARQTDGKIVIGGAFTMCGFTGRNRIARVNTDGSVDSGFNPGMGMDNTVYAVAVQDTGKVVIGGAFTSYAYTSRKRLAHLNADGTLNTVFNSGNVVNNGEVKSISLTPDAKLIFGGTFTTAGGSTWNRIGRVNN